MKKKTTLVLTGVLASAALVATQAGAVSPRFGFEAGASFANLSGDDEVTEGLDSRTALHAGGILELQMAPMWSIATGLRVDLRGPKAEGEILGESFESKTSLTYLVVPATVEVRIGQGQVKPYFMAGPELGFLLSAKQTTETSAGEEETDIKDDLKSIDFSVAFGGGLEFAFDPTMSGTISAAYDLGLSNIDDGEDNVDVKNRVFRVAAGLRFQ
jgi:opacity protein-like surface antigen